jgi:hypothetical protein
MRGEIAEAVKNAIADLPETQREILLLAHRVAAHFLCDHTQPELSCGAR